MAAIPPLAVVTGASTGIGFELARQCAERGFDLVIAADEAKIHEVAATLRTHGADVHALEADLETPDGVEALCRCVTDRGQPVAALFANAGRGLGEAFLDQDFADIQRVIDTNVTGTIALIHRIGRDMRAAGSGKILITGSIAGFIPGSFQAVYNASKAFLDNFAYALREEMKGSGVTVSLLMPGATETEFFRRAGLLDTEIGRAKKDDPAEVARLGFEALMDGDGDVVTGWKNKLQTTLANITPAKTLARQHRKLAEPKTNRKT